MATIKVTFRFRARILSLQLSMAERVEADVILIFSDFKATYGKVVNAKLYTAMRQYIPTKLIGLTTSIY